MNGALRPEKGLIIVVGRLRVPSNYISPVKTFAIGGRQTIAKAQVEGHGPVPPPLPTSLLEAVLRVCLISVLFYALLQSVQRRRHCFPSEVLN